MLEPQFMCGTGFDLNRLQVCSQRLQQNQALVVRRQFSDAFVTIIADQARVEQIKYCQFFRLSRLLMVKKALMPMSQAEKN